MKHSDSLEKRFWSKVDRKSDSECWPWLAGKTHYGYGVIGIPGGKGKHIRAHRYSFTLATGIHPGLKHVCHKCDNPPCVNPAHLWLGTAKENQQDCKHKGRLGARGGRSIGRKLTADAVADIRARASIGERLADLASAYKVSRQNVDLIIKRRIWRD